MRAPLTGVLALAAAISLGGQSTLPPVVKPPSTAAVGQARPPQKPAPTQTSKAISSGELSGRVVDEGNRAIADAVVWLIGATSLYRASTDARGRFVFPAVATGDYVVLARKAGFYDGAFGKRRANGVPVPLSFVPGQALSDIQIELFRAGVITGSVVDEATEPVVGARVVAIRRFFNGVEWNYFEAGSVLTDDEGVYRIYGLPPGEYLVMTPTTQMNSRDSGTAIERRRHPEHERARPGLPHALLCGEPLLGTLAARAVDIRRSPIRGELSVDSGPRSFGERGPDRKYGRGRRSNRETRATRGAWDLHLAVKQRPLPPRSTERSDLNACPQASIGSKRAAPSALRDSSAFPRSRARGRPVSIGATCRSG